MLGPTSAQSSVLGLSGLAEGQKVAFEVKTDRMRGKVSKGNLSLA